MLLLILMMLFGLIEINQSTYLEEYGVWITTIFSTIVILYQLTDLSTTIGNSN